MNPRGISEWGAMRLVVAFMTLWSSLSYCTMANKCPPPETIMPCRCRGRNDQIQVWCSHSDLERVNTALENLMKLRNLPAIDELIVENNKMPTLPARAFGALQIGRLLLRNNGLESLSRNAFAGLENSLEEIYIVEEKLGDFPFDAIEKLKNIEAFTIEKSPIRLLPKFNGLNKLKHIRIDGSNISALPVGAFAAMNVIKQIHVTNSKVDRLAEGIFGRLDSLLLVNFTGNKIDHIQRRCFSLLPRVEVVSLGKNLLKEATSVGRSMEEFAHLKSLDLSYNQFKELPEGSFVNLRSLQMLDLKGNEISRVFTRSFTHLPALRKVDLDNNLLRNFPKSLFDSTPLLEELRMRKNLLTKGSEIAEILSSLQSLRYLDIAENGISDLLPSSIRDHSQLQTLDMSSNKIGRLNRHTFVNMASLQELSLQNNSLSTLEGGVWDLPALKELDLSHNSIGDLVPQNLQGVPNLQRLDLGHNAIKSLIQGIFSHTPSLEFVDLSSNQISQFSGEALNGLSHLQKLDLSSNHLETLQAGSFRQLTSLVSLNLSFNRINTLPTHLLNELKLLEELNLRSNSLSYIPNSFFSSQTRLKDLNLKHNTIQDVNSRLFAGLDNIEQLRLSSNKIRMFEPHAFDGFRKLRSIDLSSNRIARLPSNSFRNLPALERFEARDNLISNVELGAMANSEALQILDLAHNELTSVPEVIKTNPLLKVVDLSHNQIMKIDSGVFVKLLGLMELYLNNNRITGLQSSTFKNMTSLTIVDLDANEVADLGPETFYNLPRLIYLRMSRNKLRRIASNAFSNLASLDGVDLQENELDDIAPDAFSRTGALKYLNLSHNNLESMEKLGIQQLGSLEVLDFSYNRLSRMDIASLRQLIWLVELRLNDNGVCHIPSGVFDGMSRLKILVMRNNRIKNLQEAAFYKLRNNIAYLDVSGNPLECDCELSWLRNLIVREALQELHPSVCQGPESLKGILLKDTRNGQIICSSTINRDSNNFIHGGSSNNNEALLESNQCPPLLEAKRPAKPASRTQNNEIKQSNIINTQFNLDQSRGHYHIMDSRNNHRKDEKQLTSDDYVSGDTPTIYAGSSNIASSTSSYNPPPQEIKKSAGGGVLSSIFGIPIDFGFNFGISPSFSWGGGHKGDNKSRGDRNGHLRPPVSTSTASSSVPSQDPLPFSWLNRNPSKYEPPEYLPRKPPQPYIPLNPAQTNQQHNRLPPPATPTNVESSGSVDVHRKVLPHQYHQHGKGLVKFPESTTTTKNLYPNPETGFIPIEPFFHPNAKRNVSERNQIPQYQETTSIRNVHTATSTESAEEENGTLDDTQFVPVEIHQTTDAERTTDAEDEETERPGKKDSLSLSDFWSIFSKDGNSPGRNETTTSSQDDMSTSSYEDEEEAEESADSNGIPFNFSAPVDHPLTPTEPGDDDDEPAYNIPFGEPNKPTLTRPPHVSITGKPTITKIAESNPPKYNNAYGPKQQLPSATTDDRNGVEDEGDDERNVEIETGQKGKIPPVIIGDQNTEPRDWYYTNYNKGNNGGGGGSEGEQQLLEKLIEKNKLQNLLLEDSQQSRSSSGSNCIFTFIPPKLPICMSALVALLSTVGIRVLL